MLLAIETGTRDASVALFGAEGPLEHVALGADAASRLAPAVAGLLEGRAERLTGYALSIGPGSFTGLRIGLSFVKGLAAARPLPVIALGTLEVLAARMQKLAPGADLYLPMLDARRAQAFALLEGGHTTVPFAANGDSRASPFRAPGLFEVARVVAELSEQALVIGGDGPALISPLPPKWRAVLGAPDAVTLAELAWPRLQAGQGVPAASVELLYGQPSAAEENAGIGPGPV